MLPLTNDVVTLYDFISMLFFSFFFLILRWNGRQMARFFALMQQLTYWRKPIIVILLSSTGRWVLLNHVLSTHMNNRSHVYSVHQVHIIQGPNGQLTVRGLQPGQQLLKLPDGRLQIVNIQQKPASPQASSVGQTSSVQKIVIQPSSASQTGTSGIAASAAAGQKLIQIRSSGVATPQNVSNTVKAVKLIQSSGGTQVVQTGVGGQLIKGHLVQQVGTLVQPLTTPVVLSTNSLALSGSTTAAATTLLQPVATGSPKVVISASQLGSTGPQLILTNPTTATTMTATQTGRQEVVKQEPPSSPQMTSVAGAAAPTTGNTGTPHKIILTSQQFAPKVSQWMYALPGAPTLPTFSILPQFPQ